jgi:hypothetical protein
VTAAADRRAIFRRIMEIGPLRERLTKLQSRLETLQGHL